MEENKQSSLIEVEHIQDDQLVIHNKLKDLQKILDKFHAQMIDYQNALINNKSPLRYPGGKTRACKILKRVLLEYFDVSKYDTLYSPFFGGGSFEFHLQNEFKFNVICNDKFKPLYNFWNVCKNDKKTLCKKLRSATITKKEFSSMRKLIMGEENSMMQAYYYFIINRCSFSGATLSGGFSEEASKKRFTKSSIDRIDNLNLSKFTIYNEDFSSFITSKCSNRNSVVPRLANDICVPRSNGIIFLDPPYYLEKNSKLYGNSGDMHENFDHELLHTILKEKKYWIMTYNDCKFIRKLYKDFTIVEVNWSYGMNKSKKSSEIVILNNQ